MVGFWAGTVVVDCKGALNTLLWLWGSEKLVELSGVVDVAR